MALERVGFGPVFLAPKRRFMFTVVLKRFWLPYDELISNTILEELADVGLEGYDAAARKESISEKAEPQSTVRASLLRLKWDLVLVTLTAERLNTRC